MSALESTAVLITVFLVIASFGYTALALASGPDSARALICFAPAVGLAIAVVVSTYLVRWTGILFPGFSTLLAVAAAASIAINFLRLGLRPSDLALVTGLCLIAGLVFFMPLIRFGMQMPYGGDAMSFVEVAQRPTTDMFVVRAREINWDYFPDAYLVEAFVRSDTKLGSLFVYSVIQKAFSIKWSFDMYPIAMALGAVVGASTVAGSIRLASYGRSWVPFAIGVALLVTPNGFSWASMTGFFPQTIGLPLALALASLTYAGCFASHAGQFTQPRVEELAIFALLLASLIFSYADVIAPLSASLVLAFIILLVQGGRIALVDNIRAGFLAAAFTVIGAALIANVELLHLTHGVNFVLNGLGNGILSTPTPVGSPILWPVWQFPAIELGLRPWDDMYFHRLYGMDFASLPIPVAISLFLTIVTTVGVIAALFLSYRQRPRNGVLIQTIFILLLAFALIWFRYIVPSPWGVGVGHTFLQMRTTTWGAIFCFVVIGVAFATTIQQWPKSSPVLATILLAWIFVGSFHVYNLAESTSAVLRGETGGRGFSSLLDVRELVRSIPVDEPILLDLPIGSPTGAYLRYVLSDRMLVGQWVKSSAPDFEKYTCTARWRLVPKSSIRSDLGVERFTPTGCGDFRQAGAKPAG